jgi:hypothetical protein
MTTTPVGAVAGDAAAAVGVATSAWTHRAPKRARRHRAAPRPRGERPSRRRGTTMTTARRSAARTWATTCSITRNRSTACRRRGRTPWIRARCRGPRTTSSRTSWSRGTSTRSATRTKARRSRRRRRRATRATIRIGPGSPKGRSRSSRSRARRRCRCSDGERSAGVVDRGAVARCAAGGGSPRRPLACRTPPCRRAVGTGARDDPARNSEAGDLRPPLQTAATHDPGRPLGSSVPFSR